MNNQFKKIKNSNIPADRLFYLKAVKQMIEMGERLNRIVPSEETTKTIEALKEEIKDYKLYPKLEQPSQ